MKTFTIEQTAKEILKRLSGITGTSYFTFVFGTDEEDIKIRVSDHSARHRNNGDERCFSFCTNFVKHSDSNPMMDEWIVNQDGYCEDYQKTIEEILDWEFN